MSVCEGSNFFFQTEATGFQDDFQLQYIYQDNLKVKWREGGGWRV